MSDEQIRTESFRLGLEVGRSALSPADRLAAFKLGVEHAHLGRRPGGVLGGLFWDSCVKDALARLDAPAELASVGD